VAITIGLIKGLKKKVTQGNLVDSPNQRVILRLRVSEEFEAKTGTARKLVQGTYADQIYSKTLKKTGLLPCPFSKSANLQLNPELRNRQKQLAKQGNLPNPLHCLERKGKKANETHDF
jgi:hypothetical protein